MNLFNLEMSLFIRIRLFLNDSAHLTCVMCAIAIKLLKYLKLLWSRASSDGFMTAWLASKLYLSKLI